MFKRSLFLCLLFFSIQIAIFSDALVVSEFPHLQTFDSWTECFYSGTCYEQQCSNFAGGWANYVEDEQDITQEQWWIIQGSTPSNVYYQNGTKLPCESLLTGPCYDHTSQTGKYMYAEATACYGFTFNVLSPVVMFSNTGARVGFYYFMYGADMTKDINATLILSMSLADVSPQQWVDVVSFSGQQQSSPLDQWRLSETQLDSYLPYVPTSSNPVRVQFRFRARTAGTRTNNLSYFMSDIAVDDVSFTQDGASNSTIPYVDPSPSPSPSVSPSPAAGGLIIDSSGDGLSDEEIGGIIGGIIGGLFLLCLLLCLLLLAILLLVSPKRKAAAKAKKPPTIEMDTQDI